MEVIKNSFQKKILAVAFGLACIFTFLNVHTTSAQSNKDATLKSLDIEVSSHNGEEIEPKFKSDITEYTLDVQSDIYGVLVKPVAKSKDANIEVIASTTPSTDWLKEDVNEPLAIKYDSKYGGYIVPLSQSYSKYGVDYSQSAEIIVTEVDGSTKTYNLTINRENAEDIYNLFEQKTYTFGDIQLPYNIYFPSNYDSSKEYPVVLALHGNGQRFQSTDMILKRNELATVWAKDSEAGVNEAIVIAPQVLPGDTNKMWTTGIMADNSTLSDWGEAAYSLLLDVMDNYSVDKERVYLTGLSMGGYGAWQMAIKYPDTFAAMIAIVGGVGKNDDVSSLKGLPITIVHAVEDPVVPFSEYENVSSKLDAEGIKYNSIIYPEGTFYSPDPHWSWTTAYADEKLRKWLFKQSQK